MKVDEIIKNIDFPLKKISNDIYININIRSSVTVTLYIHLVDFMHVLSQYTEN